MMHKYDLSIFIGRFQPFHIGHLKNVEYGLKISKKILILIGSAFRSPSIENPFSYKLRKKMILNDLVATGINPTRIMIYPLRDYLYNTNDWIEEVKNIAYKYHHSKIILIGHKKDKTSGYLNWFPHWSYIELKNFNNFNASDFRKKYFMKKIIDSSYLVHNAKNGTFYNLNKYMKNYLFTVIRNEFYYFNKFKRNCLTLEKKIILVICNKKILLFKKKYFTGKNLWSLPYIYGNRLNVIKKKNIELLIIHTLPIINYNYKIIKVVKWVKLNHILQNMSELLIEDHYQIIQFVVKYYKCIN